MSTICYDLKRLKADAKQASFKFYRGKIWAALSLTINERTRAMPAWELKNARYR